MCDLCVFLFRHLCSCRFAKIYCISLILALFVSYSCYFKLKRFSLSVMSQSFTYRYSTFKSILVGCLFELVGWLECVCVCNSTDSAEISIRIMSSHVKRIESNRSLSNIMPQLNHTYFSLNFYFSLIQMLITTVRNE